MANIFKTSYFLVEGNLHSWKQPSLLLNNTKDINSNATSYGYSALLMTYLPPLKNKNFSLLAQIGYKPRGFLEAKNLSNDIILRVGVSFLN